MSLGHGRVVPGQERAVRVSVPGVPKREPGRVIGAPVVAAEGRAREIIQDAEARATELVHEARAEIATLRERALDEARAEAAASVAEQVLRLQAREAELDARSLDRSIDLATLLAERLLGESLSLDPSRIAALARRALDEARGARRIVLWAHPDDREALAQALESGDLDRVAEIQVSPDRPRGSLRLETDLGSLDADLGPQLSRLAERLRQTLRE